jgi:hypothetical protein
MIRGRDESYWRTAESPEHPIASDEDAQNTRLPSFARLGALYFRKAGR